MKLVIDCSLLKVEKDDIIVLSIPKEDEFLTDEEFQHIKKNMNDKFPDNKTLIIQDGWKIGTQKESS